MVPSLCFPVAQKSSVPSPDTVVLSAIRHSCASTHQDVLMPTTGIVAGVFLFSFLRHNSPMQILKETISVPSKRFTRGKTVSDHTARITQGTME